jgi:hypothetical protein
MWFYPQGKAVIDFWPFKFCYCQKKKIWEIQDQWCTMIERIIRRQTMGNENGSKICSGYLLHLLVMRESIKVCLITVNCK